MFDEDFNHKVKKMKRNMVVFGIIGIFFNLVFWLGLIGGGL